MGRAKLQTLVYDILPSRKVPESGARSVGAGAGDEDVALAKLRPKALLGKLPRDEVERIIMFCCCCFLERIDTILN